MADDLEAQAIMIQQITAEIAGSCMKKGFSAPFSIDLTDQNNITISVAFAPDTERGGIKIFGIKGPDQEEAPMLVFPLKIHAEDHQGKVYDSMIERKH